MADSTAMTIDFLRARLLSERSVSRAAKERADELANRVAELEAQVREVTTQRRQAERAAAEVLAILDSQGFGGHLSDADDDSSGSDQDGDERSRGGTVRDAPEDEEESAPAAQGAAQPGGLSWKGRSVSPCKARQLKQKHRRSYFYLLSSADSSPKYRMGQSCRKNKRQTMVMMSNNDSRSASPGKDAVAAESQKGRRDGSDCTYDGQDEDMDGEVGGDERSSGGGGGGQYVIRYEEDGEMERMLERQAELIEQYEEEEKAQREWEKQYSENRNADKVAAEAEHKPCQNREGREDSNAGAGQAAPCDDDMVLPMGSLSEPPQNTSHENGAQLREVNDKHDPDQSCAQTASISAQESSNTSSTVTRQDEISDGDSCFDGNARSPRHCAIKTPSESSPSSDTLNSKVSDWSSSHFHDHRDSQLDPHQSYRPASSSNNLDVECVLEALQRARISLSARLSKPVPPNQVTLALPAPGDDLKEHEDLRADDDSNSYREERSSSRSPARQEILALPAPEDYHERVDLTLSDTGISVREKPSSSRLPHETLALPAPEDDCRREMEEYIKIPACARGLFRLPTDTFPADQRMFASGNVCGSGCGLEAAATEAPLASGDGSSGFSAQQQVDLYSSLPTAGSRCNSIARPADFTIRDTSFRSGVPEPGDADLFMQRGIDYTISNKWML